MSFFDKTWHHSRVFAEDETVDQYTKDFFSEDGSFDQARIRFTISSNLYGGKTEAKIFCPRPTGKNIFPVIEIWCTGISEQEVIDYLLTAWQRLEGHRLTSKY